MVPKVASSGRSFKGAAAYYLHDKGAQTADRVAFTETVNLPTANTRQAVAHMIDTAAHADQLKQAAGLKAGRKPQKPVYAYSLAWHPDQKPTQAEQVAAARESLEALGLSDRQALIVSHNDQAHPHVHVIVNRVCPETGKAASMSNDRLKLSQWAEDYEKRHGKVYCQARVDNNEARKGGQWRKDDSLSRRDHFEWKKEQTAKLWADYRAERDAAKAERQPQYDALWQQKEERFAARKGEIKTLFKPDWRDLFKAQRQELKEFDSHLVARLKFGLRQSKDGKIKALFGALTKDQKQRQEFLAYQEKQRLGLAGKQQQAVRDSGKEITKAWKYDRDLLRQMHAAEDRPRLDHYRDISAKLWKPEPEQTNKAQPVFDQTADRRKKENAPERQNLTGRQQAIEAARAKEAEQDQEDKKTRRHSRDVMREKRSRSRGRTRRPPR
jgi:hypothetical protein